MASSCKDAKSESGETQECLAKHRPLLSWECQEQLFRQEVENAEDLRLSIKLFHACLADKKKVIPNPPPACTTHQAHYFNISEGLRVAVLALHWVYLLWRRGIVIGDCSWLAGYVSWVSVRTPSFIHESKW